MRIGLYFIPGPGPLRELATNWLGYDIVEGKEIKRPPVLSSLVADIDEMTAIPRRYGLHATIKAPFRLASGCSLDDLKEAVDHLCRTLQPIIIPGLTLAEIDSFFCLAPQDGTGELAWLAGSCLRELDGFRAPLEEEERKRRKAKGLSPRELHLLEQWGYPYVMENFRFHITLTGPIPDPDRRRNLRPIMQSYLAKALEKPLTIDSLCLVCEREPKARFELLQCFLFKSEPEW
jgi:putative phosphonate metabolism protein